MNDSAFKHILALYIINFSSWRKYWGGGAIFPWGGGGQGSAPRIDASGMIIMQQTTCFVTRWLTSLFIIKRQQKINWCLHAQPLVLYNLPVQKSLQWFNIAMEVRTQVETHALFVQMPLFTIPAKICRKTVQYTFHLVMLCSHNNCIREQNECQEYNALSFYLMAVTFENTIHYLYSIVIAFSHCFA